MEIVKLKTSYDIRDIKAFLKDELEFFWIDMCVKDKTTHRYRKATKRDFQCGAYIAIQENKKGESNVILVKVTSKQFLIKHGSTKMDASKAWQEYQHELFDDIIKQINLANAVDVIRIK